MNGWRYSLGLGAILALLLTASTGCVAESEEEDPSAEAAEGLVSTDEASSSDGTDDNGSTPKTNPPAVTFEDQPDPLPWRELSTAPAHRLDTRSGPDPLPWAPPTTTSTGGTGSGSNQDGK